MASPSLARRDFRPRLTWNLPTRIPVPILTWNRLKLPAMARPLMPSRRPVPKLSWKWNWLMITRPRLRGMTRLKETPSRLPPPGAGAPPVRRRQRHRKGGEDAPAEHPEEEQSDTGQPQKLRMPGRRRQRVVSIDAERTVETDTDRLRNDLLDLVESLKSKKILTGTIQGVERLADNPEMSYAVIYHGDFKVIIPVLEAIEEPADYRGQPKGDVLHYLLNKRLGAEVDYIVKGVDQEHNVVAASRLEAMALKRREYYFRTDRDGNYQIYEGIRAEARVISVIRAGIFVDLFGAECYIPLRELSYQRVG